MAEQHPRIPSICFTVLEFMLNYHLNQSVPIVQQMKGKNSLCKLHLLLQSLPDHVCEKIMRPGSSF